MAVHEDAHLTFQDPIGSVVDQLHLPDHKAPERVGDLALAAQAPHRVDCRPGADRLQKAPAAADQRDDAGLGDIHGAQPEGDRYQQRPVRDAAAELTPGGPLGVHVENAEIAGHAGVSGEVGLGDGPTSGRPLTAEFEVFEKNEVQGAASIKL